MKTTIKKLGLLVAMLLAILPISAYDFEIDGIYYKVLSLTDMTCEVAYGDNKYDGHIEIPSEVTYNTRNFCVKKIGEQAFTGCSTLQSISIPTSITIIGARAFEKCSSLESIILPNSITKIEWSAFSGCESLTQFTMPNSVIEIGPGAFQACKVLKTVILSENLESIPYCSFYYCKSLEHLDIPGSVNYISQYQYSSSNSNHQYSPTFLMCNNLKRLSIQNSNERLKIGFIRHFA